MLVNMDNEAGDILFYDNFQYQYKKMSLHEVLLKPLVFLHEDRFYVVLAS